MLKTSNYMKKHSIFVQLVASSTLFICSEFNR